MAEEDTSVIVPLNPKSFCPPSTFLVPKAIEASRLHSPMPGKIAGICGEPRTLVVLSKPTSRMSKASNSGAIGPVPAKTLGGESAAGELL